MQVRARALPRKRLAFALVLIFALIAAACGDDGDDTGGGGGGGEGGGTTAPDTTEPSGDPVAGGSATLLLYSEIGTLDPLRFTGSGGSDGMRAYALYGGLVTLNPDTGEMEPLLAESFEPTSPDFLKWEIRMKPGVTFSDGAVFDAAAIKANWDRMSDLTSRSPSLTTLLTVKSTAVSATDPLVLEIELAAPNAHFDNAVGRVGTNYIASPKALAEGKDLTSEAAGAGPFLLESWLRDDRMVMKKNPDWKGTDDGVYLDELIFRVVGDEEQRVDTFSTGQADGYYTATPLSVSRGQEAVDGAYYPSVAVNTGQAFVFNTVAPPFDDVRVRKAFVQGVDWQALADTVFGEGSKALTTFTLEQTKWHAPDSVMPEYDPAAAQALIDEYNAEKGGEISFTYTAFQQSLDQARGKFIQTSLNQLNGINMEIAVGDSPTNIGKVLAGEYAVSSWGFPSVDMDPGLHNAAYSKSFTNYSKYANEQVDKWLDEARVSDDDAVRLPLYQQVYEQLAEDLPFYPYVETINGFVLSPDLKGGEVYYDGILRFDLLWLQP